MHGTTPQRFGKYQIIERIGSGGMAEVFKARMEGAGGFQRLFAIKRIRGHLSADREYVEMLIDEAKIAGLLSHANIVQILDLGQIDGLYYVAMEYVEGRDLGSVLTRCTSKGITLPVPHAVFAAIEMLKGLEYAHQRQIMRGGRPVPLNIVHRDISPSNVLVSFQGEVKLTDFGIAKAAVRALETASGIVKGKYDYMSPEQASGANLDQRSDLFSAGVVLYEMLTGRHPFRQSHEARTLDAIRSGHHDPPSVANPDVPYSLDVVLEQAICLDPQERFQSATAFKAALEKFFQDAGFIFSHSTLAAFLKGLYPEANPRQPPVSDQETVPLDRQSIEADPDLLPTQVEPAIEWEATHEMSTELRDIPRGEPGLTGNFGPAAPVDDESTLIRSVPGRQPAWSEDDGATQVQADILADPEIPEVSLEDATRTSVGQEPEAPPEQKPHHRHAPAVRTSLRTRVFMVLVGTTCLMLGLAAGLAAGWFVGSGGDLPPHLLVRLPPGARLAVAGRMVRLEDDGPTEVPLQPGVPTSVTVNVDGYSPMTTVVRLDSNQVQELLVDARTLQEHPD